MFHSKARWDFYVSKKRRKEKKKKKIHRLLHFFKTSWWADQTLHGSQCLPQAACLHLHTEVKNPH